MRILKGDLDPAGGLSRLGEVGEVVEEALSAVREGGDEALRELSLRYDGFAREDFFLSEEEVRAAFGSVDPSTVEAISVSIERVRRFHEAQMSLFRSVELSMGDGSVLGFDFVPVRRVGVYVPGGRHPLPSSAVMGVVPAVVAGVEEVLVFSPPRGGTVHPAVVVASVMAGARRICCLGGVQAMGAMAFGTESIPRVDLVVGPGNVYVAEAKRRLFGVVGVDLVAGPSEVMVIADKTAPPRFVAADLLAQCEHDPDARAVLVSLDEGLALEVMGLVDEALRSLPSGDVARASWERWGAVVLADDLEEAVELAEEVAPEHLELMVEDPLSLKGRLRSYGSLFLGPFSAESFGDYASGTNHVLPTGGSARFGEGLWVGTFLRFRSWQSLSRDSAAHLCGVVSRLARLEGLPGHALAAEVRAS